MKQFIIILLIVTSGVASAKDYKGAEIYSNQSYLYGRFEMSIQAAPGSGQLSTFFLYRNGSETANTLWQEIDIEIFGKESNLFQTNIITEQTEGTLRMTEEEHEVLANLHSDYNTYVIEWTPDSINWFLNGELIRTEHEYAQDCNAAMSMRFNHWASSNVTWVGSFNTNELPQYQHIDYISYSSHTPGVGDNGSDYTLEWTDDFSSFNTTRWSKANWTFGGNLCDFIPENAYIEDTVLVLKLHSTIIPTALSSDMYSDELLFQNLYSGTLPLSEFSANSITISILTIDGQILVSHAPMYAIENPLPTYLNTYSPGIYIVQLFKQGLL